MEHKFVTLFEAFRDEMWYDADVVSWARQCMNDYDPEIHGTRAAAEISFKEELIKARWKKYSTTLS